MTLLIVVSLAGLLVAAPHSLEAKPPKSRANAATLTLYDAGGGVGACSGLFNIEFSMVNGNVPQSLNSDNDIVLDSELGDYVRRHFVAGQLGRSPELRSNSEALSRKVQELMNGYGAMRRQKLIAYLRSRGDTVANDALQNVVTVNDRLRDFHVPQLTPDTCYAASLHTAFRYLNMQAGYDDFVTRRHGVCAALKTASQAATYSEIVAAIRSTVTNTQTAAFDWRLAPSQSLELRHRKYVQLFSNGQVLSGGFHGYALNPSRMIDEALRRSFKLPRLLQPPQLPGLYSFPGQNLQMPQLESGDLLDSDGNVVDLWSTMKWYRNVDPTTGGHIWPLKSTGDLIAALLEREVVVVGLKTENGFHTLIVSGLQYTPRMVFSRNSINYTDRSVLHRIRVIDPALSKDFEYWIEDVETFLEQYQFGFALADNISVW